MLDPIEKKPSGYFFLGNDVFGIPCFRDSFLYGTSAATVSSLLTFLCTSRSMKSFHVAFGTFMLTTFPYMIYCQEKYYSQLNELQKVQESVKKKTNDDYLVIDTFSPDNNLTPDAIV